MMTEVMSPQSTASTASDIHLNMSGIHDFRCRGGLDDCLQCVFDGILSFESKFLHSIVTHHVNFNCLEVLIFSNCCQSGTSTVSLECGQNCEEPWSRYYIPDEYIFQLISKQDLDLAFEQEKSNSRQRHRHLSFSHMIRHAKYVNVSPILQRMLADLLNLDISRRFLEQQRLTSDILLDPIGRPLEYRGYFADNVALLIPRPPCLVGTNVSTSSMNQSFEEFKKMSKLRPLFEIAAKRLSFSWARKCLPHSHQIHHAATSTNMDSSLLSPQLHSSSSAPVRLPNLFPSHQLATAASPQEDGNQTSLSAVCNSATPSPILAVETNPPSSYIGTRVSLFLTNSAMRRHFPVSHSPSPSASNKIDSCYSHTPFSDHVKFHFHQHHDFTSLSSFPNTARSFLATSAARVRWVVAIDRTIRNLLHEKIVLRLKFIAENEALRVYPEAQEENSTHRHKVGRNSSNVHQNNNKSGMQLLRSRVLAVAALSRLKSSSDNNAGSLKSPVTVVLSPSNMYGKHGTTTQETSSRTVRSTINLPPATSPLLKATSPISNSINALTAKVHGNSPASPISLPPVSISPTKPVANDSSAAAMQQLRGAWLRHRQMS